MTDRIRRAREHLDAAEAFARKQRLPRKYVDGAVQPLLDAIRLIADEVEKREGP